MVVGVDGRPLRARYSQIAATFRTAGARVAVPPRLLQESGIEHPSRPTHRYPSVTSTS